MKILIALVILAVAGCSGNASPTACHGEACQPHYAFLVDVDSAQVARFVQDKKDIACLGPLYDYDSSGELFLSYRCAWLECEGLCQ